ncbi:MAG: acyl carrier protein [Solobacterium sp.]|nr:acyl carrier protein [Solobacterium sp.]
MSDQEMMQELLKIIHVCLPETETENVTMDTVINRDLGADSMSFILMMTKVESVFNVRIPEDSWKNLATVRDVIKAVRKAQGSQKNG